MAEQGESAGFRDGLEWPTIVGSLCVGFGVLGGLYYLSGLVRTSVMAQLSDEFGVAGGLVPEGGLAVLRAAWGLDAALAVFQVFAGIALLRRVAGARRLVMVFAAGDSWG